MLLRNFRWYVASVLAIGATVLAPTRSQADIYIQVSEYNATTNTTVSVLPMVDLGPNPVTAIPPLSITPQTTANFALGGAVSFGQGTNGVSMTTTLSLGINSNFNTNVPVGTNEQLLITLMATNISNGSPINATTTISNNSGASNALELASSDGTVTVTSSTSVPGVVGSGTGNSVASNPGSAGSVGGPTTTSIFSGVPSSYDVTQTIVVQLTPNAALAGNSTFGGTVSSDVNTNAVPAVPAPGGLVLALVGLPLIGLRRAFRRTATPAAI
jgi:hypothetical protein